MPVRSRFRRWVRDGGLAALGTALVVLAAFALFRPERTPSVTLTITAGSPEGTRALLARALAEEAKAQGITLQIRETIGSEEALSQVEDGTCDLALVQGGLRIQSRENVRQLTALHVEPLHMLVKPDIEPEVAENLMGLVGRRINIGPEGSGTRDLAEAVLDFAGIEPGTYQAESRSYEDLLAETDPGLLPDVLFTVSTLPSRVARRLVERGGYRLVSLPFAEAFALSTLDAGPEFRASSLGSHVRREYVYETIIPAFTYQVEPNGVPPEPLRTLGTRLLLVGHRGVSADAVERLLEVIFSSRFAQVVYPPLDSTLLDLPPELEPQAGTLAYLHRNQPLITGDFIDMAEKWFSIGGVSAGGLLFLWQWLRRRTRARRDRGFEAYIMKVADIERRVADQELAAVIDLAILGQSLRELLDLKQEALERFAAGDLDGEELMSGFLTHVSDARSYLTRLMLHERDNLEEVARAQGRPAEALWTEALEARDLAGPP